MAGTAMYDRSTYRRQNHQYAEGTAIYGRSFYKWRERLYMAGAPIYSGRLCRTGAPIYSGRNHTWQKHPCIAEAPIGSSTYIRQGHPYREGAPICNRDSHIRPEHISGGRTHIGNGRPTKCAQRARQAKGSPQWPPPATPRPKRGTDPATLRCPRGVWGGDNRTMTQPGARKGRGRQRQHDPPNDKAGPLGTRDKAQEHTHTRPAGGTHAPTDHRREQA